MREVLIAGALVFLGCAHHTYADDDALGDAGGSETGKPNIGPQFDGGADSGSSDASTDDDGGTTTTDAGGDAKQNLLGPPCSHGAGFVAWKFHYNGSTSKITDVYSLPDSSNWDVAPAYSTSFVDSIHGGGIEIGSGNWLLIRFSVAQMSQIKGATLSVYGRSYNTTTSGSFDGWSPIYGDVKSQTNSHSNAWPYQWVSVDYSANVKVGDPPGLTGLRLYSGPNSNDLVINTVELCIDGS